MLQISNHFIELGRFIIVFSRTKHWPLPWARWIQSTPFYSISFESIVTLSYHLRVGLISGLFLSCFSFKILYALFLEDHNSIHVCLITDIHWCVVKTQNINTCAQAHYELKHFNLFLKNPLQLYISIYIQASSTVSWFKTLPKKKYALLVSSMRPTVLSIWLILCVGILNANSEGKL
jgi:hypothetical protein